ncbi:TetR family transcriptional regulator [Tsukamurella strandjordii]|uniref:TetR family transcriptional regulator n=1 Tax=Tsukamurella strandjordii TaxID=147577 RepID=A0AA90N8X4_9ACTN|nr:TetR family transcriptional regulator [Tsukamurella strandjordii]MDP0397173.1 TetR family transcriptional regulator [Tsukamurella strandjordii]
MPPDATETKRRILAAARQEFAEFGLAGARIDRIADQAQANKRSIYMHFGPKEQLFDLVVSAALRAMAEAVAFDADDLADYAVRLFDYLLAHPDTLRLTTWANLERPVITANDAETYGAKTDALAARFGDRSADVLALALGLVTAWASASPALIAPTGGDASSVAVRRTMLARAVSSLASTFSPQ